MPRFVFRVHNATAAVVNNVGNVIPPAWVVALPPNIAVGAISNVIINVPAPAAGGLPAVAFFRYQHGPGNGRWQINMAVPPPGGGAPNAAGAYTPPPAGGAVAIAPGPCPAGQPAGSICYNVAFT